MKEFVVYVMYSPSSQKFYKGQTSNLIGRFKDHNELGKKGWARKYRPWQVVHVEFFKTRSEALKRERFLKSGVGRIWIRQNVKI